MCEIVCLSQHHIMRSSIRDNAIFTCHIRAVVVCHREKWMIRLRGSEIFLDTCDIFWPKEDKRSNRIDPSIYFCIKTIKTSMYLFYYISCIGIESFGNLCINSEFFLKLFPKCTIHNTIFEEFFGHHRADNNMIETFSKRIHPIPITRQFRL